MSTCSPLRRVMRPIGFINDPQVLRRSPGMLSSTWRE
jgi:hypothetical protein